MPSPNALWFSFWVQGPRRCRRPSQAMILGLLAALSCGGQGVLAEENSPSGAAQKSAAQTSGAQTSGAQKTDDSSGKEARVEASAQWAALEEEAEKSFLEGRLFDAESKWTKARAVAESNPNKLLLAETLNQMTHLLVKQGRLAEARSNLNEALEIRRRELGEENEKTAETLGNLALIEHREGHDGLAEKHYKTVLDIKKKVGSEASRAITLTNLANLYGEMKRIEEARELYGEALKLDEKVYGADHLEVARDLFNIGGLNYHHNYFQEALSSFDKSLVIYEKLGDSQGQIKCHHYIGLCRAHLNEHDKAVAAYKKAYALHSKIKGEGHIDTLVHQLNMARSLDTAGQSQEAEQIYKGALRVADQGHNEAKLRLVECSLEYAHFLRRHGRSQEAEKQLASVLGVYESLSASDRRRLYELPRAYSDLLRELKREEEADQMARKHLHVYGTSAVKPAGKKNRKVR